MECGAIGHRMGIVQWLVVEASDPEPDSATIHHPRITGRQCLGEDEEFQACNSEACSGKNKSLISIYWNIFAQVENIHDVNYTGN